MFHRTIAPSAMALLLMTNSLFAAPEDYADYIPHNINDMELVDWSLLEDQLVAYYGETVGRATLRIFPAPEADPRGAQAEDPETSGATPAAQRAMLDLLSENLAVGTNALGDGYTTNPVRLFSINIGGSEAMAGELACGVVERSHESEGGDERARLLKDRVCLTQNGEDIVAVQITSPSRPGAMASSIDEAQITFSGLLIGTIVQLKAEDGAEEG